MKTRYASFALLLAVVLGILTTMGGRPATVQAAADHPPQTALPLWLTRLPGIAKVLANDGWQASGVTVSQGDLVTVEYLGGLWYPDGVWHDASGSPNPWICADPVCHEPLHDFPKYALIGAIAKDRSPASILRIGNRLAFTAARSGMLYLRGNYGDVDLPIHNPPGSVTVRIQVQKSSQVEVFANRGWQDSGVKVTPGDRITIEYVSGLWYPDGVWHDASGGPNPWTCAWTFCHEPLHDFPKYALIGAVGDERDPATLLRIGNRLEFTATKPGVLYLRGNYGDVDLPIHNPPGSVIVRISGY